MQIPKASSAAYAIFGIYRLLIIFFILFTLYFAQTIVIPLTLAALLTFLLSPLVTWLERWLGRVLAVLFAVIILFSTIGVIGYVFTRQLVQFGSKLPDYKENVQQKMQAFHFPEGGALNRIWEKVGNWKDELFGESSTPFESSPLAMKLVDLSSNFIHFAESFFGSFFNIIGTTGIVLLLVIFMLLNREDIRGRIIKLLGQDRISSTTKAMYDASERVSSYLFRQFVVNVIFGITVALGLYLIGIPNAILWGGLATLLRFIPYIGSWIAAIIPIVVSFIITATWIVPLLTIAFFIILELTTAYVIEPWYFGIGTGVSPFALVMAAIFWTWLWGPIGLLLSTPLTVCLVVIGQHVPTLSFLRVLLSQEQALAPFEECYHRLLSFDSTEAMTTVESYLKEHSLTSLYDDVLVPVIVQAETDYRQGSIEIEKRESVYQNIHEILDDLGESELKGVNGDQQKSIAKAKVLCIPSKTMRDELGTIMLAQLFIHESSQAHFIPSKISLNEIVSLVESKGFNAICITNVAPFSLSHVSYLCSKLHQQLPQLTIVVGLLGNQEIAPEMLEKLSSSGAKAPAYSLKEAIKILKNIDIQ